MATSQLGSLSQIFTLRRILLVLGVTGLVIVPTGAVVINSGVFDAVGPQEEVVLAPYDGPNGKYAEIDSNRELSINVTNNGTNPNSVTNFARVFTITNTGNDTKQVWITHTHQQALTFYTEETGEPITQSDNVTIGPQEQLVIGFRVDTRGQSVTVGETLQATVRIHVRVFNTPRITVPDTVEIGPVTNGTSTTTNITVQNTGNASLNIEQLSITGTNASAFQFGNTDGIGPVPPGENVSIPIRFQPTSPGIKQVTLEITSNDTNTPVAETTITGKSVAPSLSILNGSDVNYGEVKTTVNETKTITIKNDGPIPIRLTGRQLVGAQASAYTIVPADSTPITLAPNDTHTISVIFAPASTGRKNAVVAFQVDGQSEPIEADLTGIGVVENLNIEPVPIRFTPLGVNKTANKIVTITNRGSAPLVLTNAELTGSDTDQFDIDIEDGLQQTLQPGEKTSFPISFTPTEAGNMTATLEVSSSDPDRPTASVPVLGEGLPPKIKSHPDSVNYGNVTVGNCVSRNVTVTNFERSPTNLHVRSATILQSGENPEAFNVTGGVPPYTLAPGESRQIEVTYCPDSPGIKTAQLRILSDAGNAPQIDVWLSNSGWRILVRDVPPTSKGVEGESEEQVRKEMGEDEVLSPNAVKNDTERVEMDVNDLPANMTQQPLDINVSTPPTRQLPAGSDKVRFIPERSGSFDINFLHNNEPNTNDSARYTPPPQREITQYIELTHAIPDSAIENPKFKYRVKKSELPAGVAPDEIEFRRYEDGKWQQYNTTLLSSAGAYYVYRVELPGLSQFVITHPNATSAADGRPPSGNQTGDDSRNNTEAPSGGGGDQQPSGQGPTPSDSTTVDKGDTIVEFLNVQNESKAALEEEVSVRQLEVSPPGWEGQDEIEANITAVDGRVQIGADVSARITNEQQVLRRVKAKGADALTYVQNPIQLTGNLSVYRSKDAIDNHWRMVHRTEISVPARLENQSANVYLRVPRDRFGNTTAENAIIARQHNGWQRLDTEVVPSRSTADVVVLRARTPGFSEFAVFANNSVSYSWNVETYDERLTGVTINPSFEEVGFYNATLTVTDAFGLSDTAEYVILVNDVPDVEIKTREPVTPNESVTLEATVDDDLGNVTYNWTFPDGTTATGRVVTYTFESGEQPVQVVATDEFGARETDNKTFQTATGPIAVIQQEVQDQYWWLLAFLLLVLVLVGVWRRYGGALLIWIDTHPPEITVLKRPRLDVEQQHVLVPALRVTDEGGDLDTITVTILNYAGRQLGQETGLIGGGKTYDETSVVIATGAGPGLHSDDRYILEVSVTDAAGDEAINARIVDSSASSDAGLNTDEDSPGSGTNEIDPSTPSNENEGEWVESLAAGSEKPVDSTADVGRAAEETGADATQEAIDDEQTERTPEADGGATTSTTGTRGVESGSGAASSPEVDEFEQPVLEFKQQQVIIPTLRVIDADRRLDTIAVTLFDEDEQQIAQETDSFKEDRVYTASSIVLSPDERRQLLPTNRYIVAITVTNVGGAETTQRRVVKNRSTNPSSARDRARK